MRIPAELEQAIDGAISGVPTAELQRASEALSERYRERQFAAPVVRDEAARAAYAVVRMPATYASCWSTMTRCAETSPGFAPETILDLGAGPGTAAWAAAEVFPSLKSMTLAERDSGMRSLGQRLAAESPNQALRSATWVAADLSQELPQTGADLVIASYVIGELTEKSAAALVERASQLASGMLIVVEPGTRAGFAAIERARRQLIELGAQLCAPCPHEERCPMAAAGDWCHFSQRLERTALHRRLKGAELGYEDEKFSYVAAAKLEVARPETRIVRHPVYLPKRVELSLCTAEGLKNGLVTKSQGERYRAAKNAEWGDGWESSR